MKPATTTMTPRTVPQSTSQGLKGGFSGASSGHGGVYGVHWQPRSFMERMASLASARPRICSALRNGAAWARSVASSKRLFHAPHALDSLWLLTIPAIRAAASKTPMRATSARSRDRRAPHQRGRFGRERGGCCGVDQSLTGWDARTVRAKRLGLSNPVRPQRLSAGRQWHGYSLK